MNQKTLKNIYKSKYWDTKPQSLRVKIKGYSDPFDLELVGSDNKPDCCIGHFGYNFYFRTKAGMERKAYKSFNIVKREAKRKAKSLGLEIEYFCVKSPNGYKTKTIQ